MTRPIITQDQFEGITAHCERWAAKSLEIAKELIVYDVPLAEVAKNHDCTPAYANTIRARFYAKAQSVRLIAFKKDMRPDELAVLRPYGDDIDQLLADGFNVKDLVTYLENQGISVPDETVNKFIAESKTEGKP